MSIADLFDLKSIAFASFWIIGLAVILISFGFIHYHAYQGSRRIRDLLKLPANQVIIYSGLLLVSIGASGSSDHWWQSMLWIILAVSFGILIFTTLKAIRQNK